MQEEIASSLTQEQQIHDSHALLTFLPMLYVAWADEVLSPSEIQLIHDKIKQQTWLTEEDRDILCGWTDPVHPPSARELRRWLGLIRQTAHHFPVRKKQSLVDIGLEMAAMGRNGKAGVNIHEDALKALKDIEEILDVTDPDIIDEMIMQETRDEESLEPVLKPSFDPDALGEILDRDAPDLKRRVRSLISDPVFSIKHYTDKDEYRQKIYEWCKLLADQGLGSLAYPKEYGGKGDMGSYIAAFETLAYHDLSLVIKFGVQFGLWGGSVYNLGSEYHHKAFLPDIGTLDLPGCFAMTEAGHGSNVRDLETTATYDAETETFLIHTPSPLAFKEYIGNAALHGRMATVFAQLYTEGECYGVHAFLVPIRDAEGQPMPGVTIADSGDKLGLNGVDNGRLWFHQVRIPRENLLDRFASVSPEGAYSSPIASESRRFFTMLSTLVGGRVSVPLAALSAAKNALTISIKYAYQRRQFGPEGRSEIPIMNYPTHQRRLIPRLAKTYALDFALKYVKSRYLNHTKEDIREIEALAAGIKSIATWHTTDTIQTCREACGGNGYLAVNRLADLKADTDIFTTFEGDNTVLLQLVAKGRLSEFKQRFSSMNFFGFVRYFSQQAATAITELNPVIIRKTDSAHLRSFEFLLNAFKYRETSLVSSAARRLKHRLDQGMDSFDAFMETQTHLVMMAEAYVDSIILESFVMGVEDTENPEAQEILKKLCSLYALSEIESKSGWYLEKGYIEGGKSKAIRREVDNLCQDLLPELEGLVDAFRIPDSCIAAPIALNYPEGS